MNEGRRNYWHDFCSKGWPAGDRMQKAEILSNYEVYGPLIKGLVPSGGKIVYLESIILPGCKIGNQFLIGGTGIYHNNLVHKARQALQTAGNHILLIFNDPTQTDCGHMRNLLYRISALRTSADTPT